MARSEEAKDAPKAVEKCLPPEEERRKQAFLSALSNFCGSGAQFIEDELGGVPPKSEGVICYNCGEVVPITKKGKKDVYKCPKSRRVWNPTELG